MNIRSLEEVEESGIWWNILPEIKVEEWNPSLQGSTLQFARFSLSAMRGLGKFWRKLLGRRAAIPLGRVPVGALR